jgi:hypothetical protein
LGWAPAPNAEPGVSAQADERAWIFLVEQELDVNFAVFIDIDFLDLLIFENALPAARIPDVL